MNTDLFWVLFVAMVLWYLLLRNIMAQGIRHYQNKDYAQSEISFTRVIWLMPIVAHSYYNRATTRLMLPDYEGALADLKQALKYNPRHIMSNFELAYLLLETHRYDEALRHQHHVIDDIAPDDPRAYFLRGLIYIRLKQWQDVISDCERAIDLAKSQMEKTAQFSPYIAGGQKQQDQLAITLMSAYMLIANVYTVENNQEETMRYYALALAALDEPNAGVYNDRAESYYAFGQYEDALADYQTAENQLPKTTISLSPKTEMVIQAGKAVTLFKLGREEEARRLWNEISAENDSINDVAWIEREFYWYPTMLETAQDLITSIQNTQKQIHD